MNSPSLSIYRVSLLLMEPAYWSMPAQLQGLGHVFTQQDPRWGWLYEEKFCFVRFSASYLKIFRCSSDSKIKAKEDSLLREARRGKNLLIIGLCQNSLDLPPPVFLDTYEALLFLDEKSSRKKCSYCHNLNRKVPQKCFDWVNPPPLEKCPNQSRKKVPQTIWIWVGPPPPEWASRPELRISTNKYFLLKKL